MFLFAVWRTLIWVADSEGPYPLGERRAMAYGHLPAGTRVLSPIIVGAVMQLMAVVLVTAVFYLLARARYFPLGRPLSICADRTSCESASLLVCLSYLLTAIGVALTNIHARLYLSVKVREEVDSNHVAHSGVPSILAARLLCRLTVVLFGPVTVHAVRRRWINSMRTS
jgi:hypothetical protein